MSTSGSCILSSEFEILLQKLREAHDSQVADLQAQLRSANGSKSQRPQALKLTSHSEIMSPTLGPTGSAPTDVQTPSLESGPLDAFSPREPPMIFEGPKPVEAQRIESSSKGGVPCYDSSSGLRPKTPEGGSKEVSRKPFFGSSAASDGSTRRFSLELKDPKMKRFAEALGELDEEDNVAGGCEPIKSIVNHSAFEMIFAALILVNSLIFAFEVQMKGWDNGAKDGFTRSKFTYGDKEPWQSVLDVLDMAGKFIGAAFVVEVVLKAIGLGRRKFAKDWWNWFDTMVVTCWVLEDISGALDLPLNARALRAFRLLRLLRVLRLLRTIQLFDSLYLLNAALQGSIAVLTWSLIYLAVVQITLALLLTEGIHTFYLERSDAPLEERQQVYTYFGTASRATLTMFEMTLANWPPVCRVMAENVSEWWVLFALFHKLTLGFAVIGIINGVVMQETFKAAAQDSNVMIRDRQRQLERIGSSLRNVFVCADEGKDGHLTVEEFSNLCSNPVLSLWLSSLGLNTKDAVKVFHLLDDGDGLLTADELVEGVDRFRGVASGIDLHLHVQDLHEKLIVLNAQHSKALRSMEQRV
eukprot:CAMPEP_0178397216 /NCGR_PEP_ID=MMETSP0689_2-20121128/14130_1 /TAXON_ID=160604 /ORGANISM="Amphidinium massartii, Strain CS-259" /LENGTH=582 /DNA_ID=CAMNT_0020017915 /DNA_START=47 /DNA_END=1791 /DNA_ORIENTATION=-